MLTYLITSLPRLQPGMPPPFNHDAFVEKVRTLLDGHPHGDFELLLIHDEILATTRARFDLVLGHKPRALESLEAENRSRRLNATLHERFIPSWVFNDLPHQVLVRKWYQHLYDRAETTFLKDWAKRSLNLEEMIAGRLCKSEGMELEAFMIQMEGGFDSSWRVMVQRFEDEDMGIGNRVAKHDTIVAALAEKNLLEMERQINRVRWHIIETSLQEGTFSLDFLLAYYLKLNILARESSWNEEKGQRLLDGICHNAAEAL